MTGFGFLWRNSYVLSISTRQSTGGQQDLQVDLLGVDSHIHVWVKDPSNLSASGLQPKVQGDHSASVASLPDTGPFASVALSWDETSLRPNVSLGAVVRDSVLTADGGEARESSSRSIEMIDIGLPDATTVNAELFFIPRSSASAWTGGPVREWGPTANWAIAVRVTEPPRPNERCS
jgi:hypothetical protein